MEAPTLSNDWQELPTIERTAAERRFDARLVGRVFNVNGELCMVHEVDTERGMARVCQRRNGVLKEYYMPISEVCLWLARGLKQWD